MGRVFCSPGWPWPVAENDLEFLNFLPPTPRCWGDSPWFLCLLNGKTSQSGGLGLSVLSCLLQSTRSRRFQTVSFMDREPALFWGMRVGHRDFRAGPVSAKLLYTCSGPTIQRGGCWPEAYDWPSPAPPSEVGLNIAPQIQGVGLGAWPEARGLLGRSRDVFRSLGESGGHHTPAPDGVPKD